MRIPLLLAAVAALALATPCALHADDASTTTPTVHQQLIQARADAIVSVKMVLTITGSIQGSPIENERNQTATGVMVHSDGLVMLPSALFTPTIPRQFRSMVKDLKITPANMRVVFPGDAKEYPAILGAKDSKLGLAFVRIKDLEGRRVHAVDLSLAADPAIGTELFGVSRLGQDFDYAPVCAKAQVIASLTKPRTLWLVQGASRFVAEPLYTTEGAVAGVVINQEGVGEEASTQTCLLPLAIAKATIDRSAKAAEIALEEALEAEAEAAEEAADAAADAEQEEGDAKEGDPEADDAGEDGAGEDGAEGGDKDDADGAKPEAPSTPEPAPGDK